MNLLGPGTSVTVAADLPVTLRWAIPRRAHGCTQAPCEFANAMLRPAGPVPTQMRACPGANVAARIGITGVNPQMQTQPPASC
jgi:hypothetical protein